MRDVTSVTFKVEPEERLMLERLEKHTRLSRSEILRSAIRHYVGAMLPPTSTKGK